jgi:ubiquinone/menaquinone biosynthesis C-methylase UbiE
MKKMSLNDPAASAYFETRRAHWDEVARRRGTAAERGGAYHRRLTEIYRFIIPPGQRVLELGCGQGELLAGLRPGDGVGVDFSGEMIRSAKDRYPTLSFTEADAHALPDLGAPFDAIILSDLLDDVWDVQGILEGLQRYCAPHTRVIVNYYSRVWGFPLRAARRLGLATPVLEQNWLTSEDVADLLNLAGFEPIRRWQEILFPIPIPVVQTFFDKFLVKLPVFRSLALTNFVIARPAPAQPPAQQASVSVIVPARNEAGNIPAIFERLPQLGPQMEIVFVEGHSQDGTRAAIEREITAHAERDCRLIQQSGVGKADAVRAGFAAARGQILMILDADLTVPPEDLTRFQAALLTGKGELINGVRLVYPMERQAMQGLNLLGNKLFSLAFSWLLGQPIKDTLCGTKVLWRRDYDRIRAGRSYFGDFDPFGDFDLLFGAAKLNLKIIDLPIRYRERSYGSTNIQRWKHGWLLVRSLAVAALRLKFV